MSGTQSGGERDPAMARFMVIQATRASGVVLALLGIAILAHRFAALGRLPDAVGYVLLAVGLLDFLVWPRLLARKWRTPR